LTGLKLKSMTISPVNFAFSSAFFFSALAASVSARSLASSVLHFSNCLGTSEVEIAIHFKEWRAKGLLKLTYRFFEKVQNS
jgi:hypothetical protein